MMNTTQCDYNAVRMVGVVAESIGSITIVLEHILAIFLISKCRIVKKSVVILVINLCVIDIVTAFWGCFRAPLRQKRLDLVTLCKIDILLTTWSFNVSAFFVAAVAVERYVSVFWPMDYVHFVSKRKFVVVCWTIWISGFVVGFATLLIEFSYSEKDGCDLQMSHTDVFPWCLVLLRLICIFIIAFSYGKMYQKIASIGKIYNKSIKRGELRSIWKILFIAAPHLFLHLAYVMMFFIKPFLVTPTRAISIESHLTTIVMFLDSFIYVFRFKECRVNLYIYFCCFKRKTRQDNIRKRTLFYGPFLDGTPKK